MTKVEAEEKCGLLEIIRDLSGYPLWFLARDGSCITLDILAGGQSGGNNYWGTPFHYGDSLRNFISHRGLGDVLGYSETSYRADDSASLNIFTTDIAATRRLVEQLEGPLKTDFQVLIRNLLLASNAIEVKSRLGMLVSEEIKREEHRSPTGHDRGIHVSYSFHRLAQSAPTTEKFIKALVALECPDRDVASKILATESQALLGKVELRNGDEAVKKLATEHLNLLSKHVPALAPFITSQRGLIMRDAETNAGHADKHPKREPTEPDGSVQGR